MKIKILILRAITKNSGDKTVVVEYVAGSDEWLGWVMVANKK